MIHAEVLILRNPVLDSFSAAAHLVRDKKHIAALRHVKKVTDARAAEECGHDRQRVVAVVLGSTELAEVGAGRFPADLQTIGQAGCPFIQFWIAVASHGL